MQLRNVVDSIREELLSLPPPSEMADLVASEEVPMMKLRMLITMICDRSLMFESIDDPLANSFGCTHEFSVDLQEKLKERQ